MSHTAEISPLPVLVKLQLLAKEHMGLLPHECTPAFDFNGVDGLHAIHFLQAVEDAYGVPISEHQMFRMKTFGDVVAFVEENL